MRRDDWRRPPRPWHRKRPACAISIRHVAISRSTTDRRQARRRKSSLICVLKFVDSDSRRLYRLRSWFCSGVQPPAALNSALSLFALRGRGSAEADRPAAARRERLLHQRPRRVHRSAQHHHAIRPRIHPSRRRITDVLRSGDTPNAKRTGSTNCTGDQLARIAITTPSRALIPPTAR